MSNKAVYNPSSTPERPASMTVAGVIVGGVVALIVLRLIISVLTGIVTLVIPLALVGGGAYLVSTGKKLPGWITIAVGLLILL